MKIGKIKIFILSILVIIFLSSCSKAPEATVKELNQQQISKPQETPQASEEQKSISEPSVPSPAPTVTSSPDFIVDSTKPRNSYSGLWKLEKIFLYNGTTNSWFESQVTTNFYIEFKDDGTTCGGWAHYPLRCFKYDTYTATGDEITVTQQGYSGPPWKYRWRIDDGKLELISEFFISNVWQKASKGIAKPLEYAPKTQSSAEPSVKQGITLVLESIACDGKSYTLPIKPREIFLKFGIDSSENQGLNEMKSEGLIIDFKELLRSEGDSIMYYNMLGIDNISLTAGWTLFAVHAKWDSYSSPEFQVKLLRAFKKGYNIRTIADNPTSEELKFKFKCKIT